MATQLTPAMVSEVSICNMALSWLSANRISSLDDPSNEAALCKDNYSFARNAVLEERMWSFAQAREVSTTEDMDPWGTQYQHDKPLNWLQVFRVYCDVSSQNPDYWRTSDGWKMEDGFILSNDATVYMWGVKEITDTGKFSFQVAQTIAARLAALLAMPLSASKQQQAQMWALYQALLADAAARDGQQGSNEKIRSSSLVDARRGR